MSFVFRHRNAVSLVAWAAFTLATAIPPASAEYNPNVGRYLQRDPNGEAIMLTTVMAMNGQTMDAFATFSPTAQYDDGMSLYQFVGSNPVRYHDPDGMQGSAVDTLITSGEIATLATIGLVATNALIDQIARLTGNVAGYQAASYLASMDIDAGLALGTATFSVVQALAYLEVSDRQTAMTAVAAGAAIVSTGALTPVDIAVYSHQNRDAVAAAEHLIDAINEHSAKISSGSPGDWGSGPDWWKKEIADKLEQIARHAKRMKERTRVPWEQYIQRMLRWLDNPSGPPPAAPI